MKGHKIRFVSFLIVFFLILTILSHIYTPKGLYPYYNDRTAVLSQFYNEPKNSIDVIMIGTSRIHCTLLPAVLWDESGITSYNLAVNGGPSLTMYYWLKEALKHQSPSVVIIHSGWLYATRNVDTYEARYRESMDPMHLNINKLKAICSIVSKSKNQRTLDYIFPLLRYHGRTDLVKDDFNFTYPFKRNLTMGGRISMFHSRNSIPSPDFWDKKRKPRPIKYEEDMEKIVALCKEHNISVIMLDTPSTVETDWSMTSSELSKAWAETQDIDYVNLNSKEAWEAASFNPETDFGNSYHVNLSGGTKFSRYFADYLSNTYALPDHREGSYDPHWDEVSDYYISQCERFGKILEYFE